MYHVEQNFGEFGESPQFAKFFHQYSQGSTWSCSLCRERTTCEARHLNIDALPYE